MTRKKGAHKTTEYCVCKARPLAARWVVEYRLREPSWGPVVRAAVRGDHTETDLTEGRHTVVLDTLSGATQYADMIQHSMAMQR